MGKLICYLPNTNSQQFNYIEPDESFHVSTSENFNVQWITENGRKIAERMEHARESGKTVLSIQNETGYFRDLNLVRFILFANSMLKSPFRQVEIKIAPKFADNESIGNLGNLEGLTDIIVYLTAFESHKHQTFTGQPVDKLYDISDVLRKLSETSKNIKIELVLNKWFDHIAVEDVRKFCEEHSLKYANVRNKLTLKKDSVRSETDERLCLDLDCFPKAGTSVEGFNIYDAQGIGISLVPHPNQHDNCWHLYFPQAKLYNQHNNIASLIM